MLPWGINAASRPWYGKCVTKVSHQGLAVIDTIYPYIFDLPLLYEAVGNFGVQPVTGIFVRTAGDVLQMIFDNGDTLGVTTQHPVWSVSREGWVPAGRFEPGEVVMTLLGPAILVSVSELPGKQTVYNLEVYGDHTFHVGMSGILVHNSYNVAGLKALRADYKKAPAKVLPSEFDDLPLPRAVLEASDDVFIQFVSDLAYKVSGQTLVRAELFRAWEFVDLCPQYIRKNTTILDDLSKAINRGAKSIDELITYANQSHPAITESTLIHIFRGDSGGGRHHITAILNDNSRKLVGRGKESFDKLFYEAKFATGGKKSFWPDSWDEFKIIDEIKYILENGPSNIQGTNRWRGYLNNGQLIEYYLHNSGYIISVFPVIL